jgi:predicted nuclease of predicted toxin-antitoxin system
MTWLINLIINSPPNKDYFTWVIDVLDFFTVSFGSSMSWTLTTNDKDFGEKEYRDGQLHRGVILLRLEDESASSKIKVFERLLEVYKDRLQDSFVVVTEKQVRFAQR